MVKSVVVFLGVIAGIAIGSQPAAAAKYCAPLPVQAAGPTPTCKCAVQNYSAVADTGVTVSVYAANGGYTTCGPLTLPARTGTYCHVSIAAGTTCGCSVTGEAALTRASLSVTDPETGGPQASVDCR